MAAPDLEEPHGQVAAWLDRVLQRHPQYDADGVLDLRSRFLLQQEGSDTGRDWPTAEGSERVTSRPEATAVLRELRESFFRCEPGAIPRELQRLDLAKLPDLRASAERLALDEELRSSYALLEADRKVGTELRRLLVGNVVLPWRERRRELAEFLTARQLGAKSHHGVRRKARKGAKRVSKHYPALEGLHGWWLREVARLPRWNPLRGIFRAIRGWALNYLALIWLMFTFLMLFAGGTVGHRIFLSVLGGSGVGAP